MFSINASDIISFIVFAFSIFRVWSFFAIKIAKLETTLKNQQSEIITVKAELDSRHEELTQVRLVMEKINTTLGNTNIVISEMKETNEKLGDAIQKLQIQQASIDYGKKNSH